MQTQQVLQLSAKVEGYGFGSNACSNSIFVREVLSAKPERGLEPRPTVYKATR